MQKLFFIDRASPELKIAPIEVAEALFYKNYAKDLDKCAKDAAAWLKMNGHVKMGKPPTWRGIRLRLPHDPDSTED